jgi:hypothetical protein
MQKTVEHITLVFERFKMVFDSDFLFVRDGERGDILTGDTQVTFQLRLVFLR